MTLNPAAQQQIAEANQRRTAWLRGEAPLVDNRFGPRTVGDLALVEPGCSVWSRDDGTADQRLDHRDDKRGGVVVEISVGYQEDADTGEILRPRVFRCVDPFTLATTVLTEEQVDPHACEATDHAMLRRLWRRLAKDVASKRGTASSDELRMVTDMARLAAIVGMTRAS